MLLGHYGVALAAKRLAPQTSLGTLVFAAQWLDLLWPILLVAGIERVEYVPGIMAASPFDFVSYPISHSLIMVLVWAALIAGIYFALRKYRTGAMVVGGLVVSHWVLDFVMHRPDLPLWPGSERYGLGLWNSLPATLVIEFVLLLAGIVLYVRARPARDRIGKWALAAMAGFLIMIFVGNLFSPPPPNQTAVGLLSLGLWLFVPWAHWIDKHRESRNT
jgi:membrane-bound metal-dependent hydrolase YbcI (DUF457 family)